MDANKHPNAHAVREWLTAHPDIAEDIIKSLIAAWPTIVKAVGPIGSAIAAALPPEAQILIRTVKMAVGVK
jgi:hypothetical protein